jgi:hypothetical protein
VSAGNGHACALRTDDAVVCWLVSNEYGQNSVPPGIFKSVSAAAVTPAP